MTGDGSMQMNLQELQTIIHHRMGIKIFVINNGGYHSIRQTPEEFLWGAADWNRRGQRDLSFRLWISWRRPTATTCQQGTTASWEAVEKTLAAEGPAICEVFVSMDQNFEPKSSAKRLPDGTMVSPPLEDLSPFLPDERWMKI